MRQLSRKFWLSAIIIVFTLSVFSLATGPSAILTSLVSWSDDQIDPPPPKEIVEHLLGMATLDAGISGKIIRWEELPNVNILGGRFSTLIEVFASEQILEDFAQEYSLYVTSRPLFAGAITVIIDNDFVLDSEFIYSKQQFIHNFDGTITYYPNSLRISDINIASMRCIPEVLIERRTWHIKHASIYISPANWGQFYSCLERALPATLGFVSLDTRALSLVSGPELVGMLYSQGIEAGMSPEEAAEIVSINQPKL